MNTVFCLREWIKWLQDNFQWYRKFKGGRWAKFGEFWEREEHFLESTLDTTQSWVIFQRLPILIEDTKVWTHDVSLPFDCELIKEREDYTKK